MEEKKIAVLIPCFNESETIAKVVRDFHQVLPEAEIYVYDNNSTDDTGEKAAQAGAIVRTECRQGKGNVIRSMFRDIEADCYLMVDGDDTYPSENAREMCDFVLKQGVDMVIGDRLSSTYDKVNTRRFHDWGNRLVRYLINRIFHSEVKDVMTGYRAFNRSFVKTIPILSKGFEVETEMTIHALDKNMLLREVPVSYRERPEGSFSKLNTVNDGWKVIRTIFGLFRDYKPFLFFSILSLILFAVAAILFILVFVEYLQTGLVLRFPTLFVSGFIGIFASLLWVCGLILEVVAKKHRQLFELLYKK